MEKIKNICRDLGKAFTIGLLLIAALGMFVIAGMLMVKGKNPEKFTQKEKWRVHFAVLGYKSVFAVLCVSWVLWAAAADYLLYRM